MIEPRRKKNALCYTLGLTEGPFILTISQTLYIINLGLKVKNKKERKKENRSLTEKS